jgi:NADPH-dependent ferric siderophore reductase
MSALSAARQRPLPVHAGVATVLAASMTTPAMRRFTLTAPAFAEPGCEQPGEILTLGWPLDGEELVLPGVGWHFPQGSPEQHWRNFSVRRWDPAAETIDVEVFLHGDAGIASRWALRASVGDTVGFAGPRLHWEPDPAARWSLLVADETGLPALLAILETLPVGHRAIALAEVADERERQQVACAATVEWHWLLRGEREPGTAPELLLDAVRALELPKDPGQAWGGGESLAIRDVRRHLAAHCPQVAGSMRLLGYWKHRTTPDDVE